MLGFKCFPAPLRVIKFAIRRVLGIGTSKPRSRHASKGAMLENPRAFCTNTGLASTGCPYCIGVLSMSTSSSRLSEKRASGKFRQSCDMQTTFLQPCWHFGGLSLISQMVSMAMRHRCRGNPRPLAKPEDNATLWSHIQNVALVPCTSNIPQ